MILRLKRSPVAWLCHSAIGTHVVVLDLFCHSLITDGPKTQMMTFAFLHYVLPQCFPHSLNPVHWVLEQPEPSSNWPLPDQEAKSWHSETAWYDSTPNSKCFSPTSEMKPLTFFWSFVWHFICTRLSNKHRWGKDVMKFKHILIYIYICTII